MPSEALKNARHERRWRSAGIFYAVAVAVGGEHHIASVEDMGRIVVGHRHLALEDIVYLCIVHMGVLLNHAAHRQVYAVEALEAAAHLCRGQHQVLDHFAVEVAHIGSRLALYIFFLLDHNLIV